METLPGDGTISKSLGRRGSPTPHGPPSWALPFLSSPWTKGDTEQTVAPQILAKKHQSREDKSKLLSCPLGVPPGVARSVCVCGAAPHPNSRPRGLCFSRFLRVSPSRPNGQPRLEKTRKTKPPGPGITPAALSGRERAAGVIPEAGLSQPQRLSPAAATQSLLVSSGHLGGWERPRGLGNHSRGVFGA